MGVVAEIEQALIAQWSEFGRWSRASLHERDGLLELEMPIRRLPYNAVVRTRLGDGDAAEPAIAAAVERFRARGVQCLWFVHPSSTPADLGERLRAHGLEPVERATGMSLELADWEPPPPPDGVAIEQVLDDAVLRAYGAPAIFGMSIRPEARGRGLAGALTAALVAHGRELGYARVVLHSSDMALGVYRRAGFVERCTIWIYATESLWSDGH